MLEKTTTADIPSNLEIVPFDLRLSLHKGLNGKDHILLCIRPIKAAVQVRESSSFILHNQAACECKCQYCCMI